MSAAVPSSLNIDEQPSQWRLGDLNRVDRDDVVTNPGSTVDHHMQYWVGVVTDVRVRESIHALNIIAIFQCSRHLSLPEGSTIH